MSHRAASRVTFHWFMPRTPKVRVERPSLKRVNVSRPEVRKVQVVYPRLVAATLEEPIEVPPEPQALLKLGLREVFFQHNPTLAELLDRARRLLPGATEETVLDFINLLNRDLSRPEVLWTAETGQYGMLPWVKLGFDFDGSGLQGWSYRNSSLSFWELRSRMVGRSQFELEVRTHELDPWVLERALKLPEVPEMFRPAAPDVTPPHPWIRVDVRGRALWVNPHRFPRGGLLTEKRGGRVTPICVHEGQLMHGYVPITPQWSKMLEWMLKLAETPGGRAYSRDGRLYQLFDPAHGVVEQLQELLKDPHTRL